MPHIDTETYDNFPLHIVLFCNAISLSIYTLGAFIIAPHGTAYVALYISYCLLLEIRVLVISCRNCFYYGEFCAFGKGRICSLFFKKGAPERFSAKAITWFDILPDFLVSLVPIVIGVVSLTISFSWVMLLLVVMISVMAFPVTGFIRSSIACKFCRQREIGCPALQLFSKNNN